MPGRWEAGTMTPVDPNVLFTTKGAVTLSKRHQFAGREDLIATCLDELSIDGSTLIIFGERGVGKTSLGWQLVGPLSGDASLLKERGIRPKLLRKPDFHVIWCTCNSLMKTISDVVDSLISDAEPHFTLRSNFPAVFNDRKLINRLTQTYKVKVPVGIEAELKIDPAPRTRRAGSRVGNEELGSFLLLKELLELARKQYPNRMGFVLVLDEFDQIGDNAGIGLLVKTLNNARFVILGVGTSRSALIGQHGSVSRKIHSSEVPLFSIDNVNWFFDSVEEHSKKQVFFKPGFRKDVFSRSSGFPWLVQQLGFYCLLDVMPPDGVIDSVIVLDSSDLNRVLPKFVKDKLGNDQFDLSQLSTTSSDLLRALAGSAKGRMSEQQLLSTLNEQKRPFYDASIRQLKDAGLVHEQGADVRLQDPMSKILIGLAIKEGLL
jgi:hypothetical protein